MTAAPVALVEVLGVAGLKRLHQLGEVALRRGQEQMDVIGEQTVTAKIDRFLFAIPQKLVEIVLAVGVVFEDRLAVVPARDHVINRPWIFNPHRPRHLRIPRSATSL